jgi:pyrroline-5-carboxylate reductase
MGNDKIGLVGLGKLGTAMMSHWNKNDIKIGVFHRDPTKAREFVNQFQKGYLLAASELKDLDLLILALPATEIIPFITSLKIQGNSDHSPYFINMATTLHTNEISKAFPNLNVIGIKYMGHARDLLEHGNGLFISENTLPKIIEELFSNLGNVKQESENCLAEVNKLATFYAVKTAAEIENEFARRGYPLEYVKRALTSISPEVIRSYSEGSLGHFAKEIAKKIQQND